MDKCFHGKYFEFFDYRGMNYESKDIDSYPKGKEFEVMWSNKNEATAKELGIFVKVKPINIIVCKIPK